jgi:hypothetical protein
MVFQSQKNKLSKNGPVETHREAVMVGVRSETDLGIHPIATVTALPIPHPHPATPHP